MSDRLLLETGDGFLLETGDGLLLETTTGAPIYGPGCYTLTIAVPPEDVGATLTFDWTATGPWTVEYRTRASVPALLLLETAAHVLLETTGAVELEP